MRRVVSYIVSLHASFLSLSNTRAIFRRDSQDSPILCPRTRALLNDSGDSRRRRRVGSFRADEPRRRIKAGISADEQTSTVRDYCRCSCRDALPRVVRKIYARATLGNRISFLRRNRGEIEERIAREREEREVSDFFKLYL